MNRRIFNKSIVYALIASSFKSTLVLAQSKLPPLKDLRLGFGLSGINQTINAITENAKVNPSALIFLNKIANEAQDGRRVPIEITTSLTNVEKIAILFDKNPNITSAIFDFNPNLEPYIATSIKMQESGTLYVLIKSDKNWFVAKKVVKVLIGGCS